MSKILVLLQNEPPQIEAILGDGITPELALKMCSAAVEFFRQQIFEAEIERRIAKAQEEKP